MANSFIVSIDPGAKGAAAFFLGPILTHVISFNKNEDWRTIMFGHCRLLKPEIAILENTHSWSGQGVKSMHSFGERKGEVKTVLHLAKIPIQLVEPQEWQRKLGLLRKEKSDHKELALKLYPHLANVKGDVYDAVLIGWSQINSPLG